MNPYVVHFFGKLRVGPGTAATQILAQAKRLANRLAAGEAMELGGLALDEHAIGEAKRKLLEPAALAQELLLVHSPGPREGGALSALTEDVRKVAELPGPRPTLSLQHPLAIFWFVPEPRATSIELPAWTDFGFVDVGDQEDLDLDVVFDS